MRTRTLTALALAIGVSAAPLSAQSGRGGTPDGARRGAPPVDGPADARGAMLRGPASPAAMLLRQRERLALTPEQVTRLETLAATQQKSLAPASPAQQLRLRADLLDAMSGTGNPQAARAALDKMSAERNERLVAGLRARQEAQAVLTEAQRTQVEALRTTMRQRAGRARTGRLGDGRAGARFRQGRGPGRADVARGRRGDAPDGARPPRPRRPDAP